MHTDIFLVKMAAFFRIMFQCLVIILLLNFALTDGDEDKGKNVKSPCREGYVFTSEGKCIKSAIIQA